MVHQEDASLVEAAARGDQQARRSLVERLIGRVRSTVVYLSPSSPDIDDITQRALMEILGSCNTYRGESRLEAWADRIVTRTALRQLQNRRTAEAREQGVDEVPEYPDWSHASQSPTELADEQREVATLLAKLPAERREALVLKHVQGYSVEEIAAATHTKVNTVRDRLRVGRAQLRAWLSGREPGSDDES